MTRGSIGMGGADDGPPDPAADPAPTPSMVARARSRAASWSAVLREPVAPGDPPADALAPGAPDLKVAIQRAGLALILALVLLVVVLALSQYRGATLRAAAEAHRSAHVVATQFYWVFQTSAQALKRIEDFVRDPADDPTPSEIANLRDAVRELPGEFHYGVYDARGDLRFSSLAPAHSVNVADRNYFSALRDGTEIDVFPQVTDRQTGEQTFIVARRLNRGDTFLGVATIAIPQTQMEVLADTMRLDSKSTVSLVHVNGMVLVRSPPIEPTDISGGTLFESYSVSPDGYYESAVSPVDGVRRLVGYWKIDGWPVIALTSYSHSFAYAEWVRLWTIVLPLSLPLGLTFWLFLRHVNRQIEREHLQLKALADANERSGFLLREIHHRVKNNLQTVMSLVRMERIQGDIKTELLSRIATMVEVHEEMYNSEHSEWINLRVYLPRLVNRIAASHPVPVRLELDVEPLLLPGERAMLIGLLANELVTNAYKHALSRVADPLLQLSLTQPQPGSMRLVVCDNGPGYQRDVASTGLGNQLIEAFADQLGGTIEFDTDARVCITVDFPARLARRS